MIPRVSVALYVASAVAVGTLAATPAVAQPPAKPSITITALMVEVTLSRYQGDKRTSNLPYTIAVMPDNNRSTLRVGGDVAVLTTTYLPTSAAKEGNATPGSAGETKVNPLSSYGYRPIGTNIDVNATPLEDGRFRVVISIEETSIYPPGETAKTMNTVPGAPAFRRLSSSNALALRDGQNVDYTAATDRITGEVVRIGVKLTVVK